MNNLICIPNKLKFCRLEEENKIEEAEKSFKKCLAINPDHEPGKEALR